MKPSKVQNGFFLLALAGALIGCGGGGDGETPAMEGEPASGALSAEAQILVNQGNAAQRAGQYTEALEHFTKALEMHPDHPVPQFGSLMAAEALGDTALALSLRSKLEKTGPELLDMLGPGGTMGGAAPHGQTPDTSAPGTLPMGHPPIGGGISS